MAQITQAQWDAFTREEQDKFLRDLVRWPDPHKAFPIAFDTADSTGRVVHHTVKEKHNETTNQPHYPTRP